MAAASSSTTVEALEDVSLSRFFPGYALEQTPLPASHHALPVKQWYSPVI
jgi:hypothetical protein